MRLTFRPLNKLSPAKFLVCFNFQTASMSLKDGRHFEFSVCVCVCVCVSVFLSVCVFSTLILAIKFDLVEIDTSFVGKLCAL